MSKAVFCMVKSEALARDIVEKLKVMGFPASDISVLFADRSGTRDFAYEQNTKAPEGATAGGLVGAGAGGVLGWLAGIGTLAIPGIGPFIAAGPIMAALAGMGIGAATGGLLGALVGLGIPEFEAKRYEGKLREGNILISVHVEDSKEQSRAKDVFEVAGAQDISTTGEAAVPKVPLSPRAGGTLKDRDGDGVPNRVDPDRDNDGVSNRADALPDDPTRR
jgi:hypothetical protein